ncbi:MAG TPA: hypothetical protein VGX94_18895 [Terriglobia bacterium]|nr:hypothetical protein [Terriglobia bacterium]
MDVPLGMVAAWTAWRYINVAPAIAARAQTTVPSVTVAKRRRAMNLKNDIE